MIETNELEVYRNTVELAPLEDVAKFMLIAPEKAKAQAAEIRAMRSLGVAQEVLAQKEEEQRMLNELILDAGARIGELTREFPKAKNQYAHESACSTAGTSTQDKPKTKEQIGAELGFTRHDMSRFEKLASNKDLVEEEKEMARKENRMPTRTNVLKRARERDKCISEEEEVETEKPKKRKYNTQNLVPGGFNKEELERRAQIANAAQVLYDTGTDSQYTLDALVQDIEANGNAACSVLKALLKPWNHLFETEEDKMEVSKAINDYYWKNIIQVKGEFNL